MVTFLTKNKKTIPARREQTVVSRSSPERTGGMRVFSGNEHTHISHGPRTGSPTSYFFMPVSESPDSLIPLFLDTETSTLTLQTLYI